MYAICKTLNPIAPLPASLPCADVKMLRSVAAVGTVVTRAAAAARLVAFPNSFRPLSSIVPLMDLLLSSGSGGRWPSLRPFAFNHSAQYHGRSRDGEVRLGGAKQDISDCDDDDDYDDDDDEEEVDDAGFSVDDSDDDMSGGYYNDSGDEIKEDDLAKAFNHKFNK